MKIEVIRDTLTHDASLGKMLVNGSFFGYTCEDKDRELETYPDRKVMHETAIPRGTYKVVVSFSHHFDRELPELLDVPGFTGVRIHGGNGPADTDGCVLLGRVRTADGCANCAERNTTLMNMIQQAEDAGEDVCISIF